jgi:site-specific DNA-methyltransferase (adenine-specific)
MTEYLKPSRCWIFWDKLKFVDNYADGELAWTSFDRNTKKVQIQHHGYLTADKKIENTASIHPTQKPVILYEWILNNFAEKGNKILDTHIGSGSIAIACNNLDYELTGCELNTSYYNKMIKRVKNHTNQIKIF